MITEPDIVDLQEIMQKMKGVKRMVPFVAVNNITKTPQYAVVERFVNAEFWKPEFDDLFAPDIRVEFPHAVPGMPMYMIPYEFNEVFRFWLCKTVKSIRQSMLPALFQLRIRTCFGRFVRWRTRYTGQRRTAFSAVSSQTGLW